MFASYVPVAIITSTKSVNKKQKFNYVVSKLLESNVPVEVIDTARIVFIIE